jgi:hypothetical protein
MRFNTVLCYVKNNERLLAEQRQFLFLCDNRMFLLHQMNVHLGQKELVYFEKTKKKKKKANTACTKLMVPSFLSISSPRYTNMPVGTLIKEETGKE